MYRFRSDQRLSLCRPRLYRRTYLHLGPVSHLGLPPLEGRRLPWLRCRPLLHRFRSDVRLSLCPLLLHRRTCLHHRLPESHSRLEPGQLQLLLLFGATVSQLATTGFSFGASAQPAVFATPQSSTFFGASHTAGGDPLVVAAPNFGVAPTNTFNLGGGTSSSGVGAGGASARRRAAKSSGRKK
jgi:hypothetical protein